ncbi:uncharacterized protein LOC114754218 [Neltuma alba]|uniref:uncharacterized protein LOC114754218 n=1 Tax=Neltuma alba TaxID=207710 RepID=UPI0010A39C80|nr:uncharacterized protein LOC114754218 [Prosopis alba]
MSCEQKSKGSLGRNHVPPSGWCKLNTKDVLRTEVKRIAWQKPPSRWCKLNTNGMQRSSGEAGCTEAIRGDTQEWLCGYSLKLGRQNSLSAEARGILEGLRICWSMGFRKIIVESDAKQVLESMQQRKDIEGNSIVSKEIRKALNKEWEIEIRHVY